GKPYRWAPLTVTNSARGRWWRASSARRVRSRSIDHPPAGRDQEAVDPLVVGPLRQLRRGEGFLELPVQVEGAQPHLLEGQGAALDVQQLLAVFADVHQDLAGPQGVDAAEEQADQVHRVLGP